MSRIFTAHAKQRPGNNRPVTAPKKTSSLRSRPEDTSGLALPFAMLFEGQSCFLTGAGVPGACGFAGDPATSHAKVASTYSSTSTGKSSHPTGIDMHSNMQPVPFKLI